MKKDLDTDIRPYALHKNELKMDHRLKCNMQIYKTSPQSSRKPR